MNHYPLLDAYIEACWAGEAPAGLLKQERFRGLLEHLGGCDQCRMRFEEEAIALIEHRADLERLSREDESDAAEVAQEVTERLLAGPASGLWEVLRTRLQALGAKLRPGFDWQSLPFPHYPTGEDEGEPLASGRALGAAWDRLAAVTLHGESHPIILTAQFPSLPQQGWESRVDMYIRPHQLTAHICPLPGFEGPRALPRFAVVSADRSRLLLDSGPDEERYDDVGEGEYAVRVWETQEVDLRDEISFEPLDVVVFFVESADVGR